MALRFHWRLPQGGETAGTTRATGVSLVQTGIPDIAAQSAFCRQAEACGIDGVLIDFGASKPDSILLATAVGMATQQIECIIAHRSGLLSPTLFVQQLNTLSTCINGRLSLNIVAGHSPQEQRAYGDHLSHEARYARTAEFLEICHAFWHRAADVTFDGAHYTVEQGKLTTPFVSPRRTFPELFIAGGSEAARTLAIRHGTCWMRLADTPERLAPSIAPVLEAGKEVGLRLSIIARPTHTEALGAAEALLAGLDSAMQEQEHEKAFVQHSDSESIKAMYRLAETEWLTPWLWTGAVRSHGAPAIALVGTPTEVATAIMAYARIGISQFIFSGWPKLDSMLYFGQEILPLIRGEER
jgi:alkanesulfonate monooxygenase